MDESDRQLFRHLLDGHAEITKSLYDVHGSISTVRERVEHMIVAQRASAERQDEHSGLIDDTAAKVMRWEAQVRLIVWVATFFGSGGLIAVIAMLARVAK